MENYPFKKVEDKWRKLWKERGTNRVDLNRVENKKYVVVMFSYPSEKKLHIGHWWNYTGTDIYARFNRMKGYNVFEPMGFDAFGLPAENFAVQHGVHPGTTTRNSVKLIREQLNQIGAMYDWDKEVNTSEPEYYKWTQWLFLQLFKTGSAYRKKSPVNWCPKCMTVLANEQVLSNGSCERCDTIVETRDLKQWFFRITDFADQLIDDLDDLDWPESTKVVQKHWIGRSEGTEIIFKVAGSSDLIHTFTTRADTLFGVTYVVLAPEHELVGKITTYEQKSEVKQYIADARAKSDIERLSADKAKTGVFTGAYAINPVSGEEVPVWIADYVLSTYGTGAVMAVPAHDQRDFEFSRKYGLPVKWVIASSNPSDELPKDKAYEEHGVMHDSGQFDGLSSDEGMKAVTKWLEENNSGKATVSYRLRDWSVSRQRYWGAPIPIVYCPKCGIVPVPEKDLPVVLPEDIEDFTPRGTSPLGAIDSFMNVACPKCGEDAKRDPDTMDTFVDSSWYFLRYPSTDFHDRPFDAERTRNWLPIDVYIGGPEHRTGHLIYARYITKFLNSIGMIDFNEPAKRMIHQGIIAHKGERMSKSKGNVINPDGFIEEYGVDCFRMYAMFMGDFTIGGEWSDEGIVGIKRFQNRVWRLVTQWAPKIKDIKDEILEPDPEINRTLHYTIKEVTNGLEQFQFNTSISRIMELVNALYLYIAEPKKVNRPFLKDTLERLVMLLGPLASHLCEELWETLGHQGSLFDQKWSQWDEDVLKRETVTVAIQINGKMITTIEIAKGSSEDEVLEEALKIEKVKRRISNKKIRRKVFIKDRILNVVV